MISQVSQTGLRGAQPTADPITIAVTVYDRRQYLSQAISSALDQTVPVRVIVVEDCGPDVGMERFVCEKFGNRIKYFRNPRRRGLFGNWNACLELCETRWLSILHDDDFLKPCLAETMLQLLTEAPGRGLYFGNFVLVSERGERVPYPQRPVANPWEEIDLRALAEENFLGFAGQLIDVAYVQALGGFREHSRFCGDWEMWFKLAINYGGIRASRVVACARSYHDRQRGTSQVVRSGKAFGLSIVQGKRNYALLRQKGLAGPLHSRLLRNRFAPHPRFLLDHAMHFSSRWLTYNVELFLHSGSDPASAASWLFKILVRLLGRRFVRGLSRLWNWRIRSQSSCLAASKQV